MADKDNNLLGMRYVKKNAKLLVVQCFEQWLLKPETLCSISDEFPSLTFTHLYHMQLVKNPKITHVHHKCQTTGLCSC